MLLKLCHLLSYLPVIFQCVIFSKRFQACLKSSTSLPKATFPALIPAAVSYPSTAYYSALNIHTILYTDMPIRTGFFFLFFGIKREISTMKYNICTG